MAYPYKPSSRKRNTAASRIQRAWRRRPRKARATSIKLRKFTSGNYHNFHRTEWKANQAITCDGVGLGAIGLSFQLVDITDYLSFNPLFDAFKLRGVQVQVIPLVNVYNQDSTQVNLPQVVMAIDYDDSLAPSSVEKLLCRMGATMKPFSRAISKYVRPKLSGVVYSSGVAADYKQTKGWLDLPAGNDVPHYGLKIAFQGRPAQVIDYHIKFKYYLTFKEPIVR